MDLLSIVLRWKKISVEEMAQFMGILKAECDFEVNWIEYVRSLKQGFCEISSALDDIDLSKPDPAWLLAKELAGFGRALDIHQSVPEHLAATGDDLLVFALPEKCLEDPAVGYYTLIDTAFRGGDDFLIFALQNIKNPIIVFEAYIDIALGERCWNEAIRRGRRYPIALNLQSLLYFPNRESIAYKAIMNILQKYTSQLHLPEEIGTSEAQIEKDGILRLKLAENLNKLRELPIRDILIKGMRGEFEHLPKEIKNRFIDEIRKQNPKRPGQRRIPPNMLQSLDAEVEELDGSITPMLRLLETPSVSDLELEFTPENRKRLDETIGKKARMVLELSYMGYSDKEIANKLGYKSQGSISKLWRKIEENNHLIREILFG